MNEGELRKALEELKKSIRSDNNMKWFVGGVWLGIAIGGICTLIM